MFRLTWPFKHTRDRANSTNHMPQIAAP